MHSGLVVTIYNDIQISIMKRMELVTKEFLTETLSHEFEKFALMIGGQFNRIDERFDGIDHRLDKIEYRLDVVEDRLDGMDSRLGKVEYNLFELSEKLDEEMNFTSDLRDDLSRRVVVLEMKEK